MRGVSESNLRDFPLNDSEMQEPDDIDQGQSDDGSAPSGGSLIDQLDSNADSFQQALIQSFGEYEREYRRKHPVIWVAALIGPMLAIVVALGLVALIQGPDKSGDYLAAAAQTFTIWGRFAIPMASLEAVVVPSGDFRPIQAFWMLMLMDTMTALFVSYHMGFLFRIPIVGPKVGALVYDGKFILESNPWMKKIAFLGLVAFVIFPTSTTGSVGGSIFGRLLGLSRFWTLTGIAIGGLIGNGIMLGLAEVIANNFDPRNIYFKIAGIAIVVGLIVAIELRYRTLKKRYMASREK